MSKRKRDNTMSNKTRQAIRRLRRMARDLMTQADEMETALEEPEPDPEPRAPSQKSPVKDEPKKDDDDD